MELMNKEIGFAMTGSYCTFDQVIPQIRKLKECGAHIHPIVSENVSKTDTRFMKAEDLYEKLQCITGREIIDTIVKAEPIGPNSLLDLLIVAPCTGNTASKIALGITDTPVVMAVKGHIRNQKPVLIAIATNDALGASAKKHRSPAQHAEHLFCSHVAGQLCEKDHIHGCGNGFDPESSGHGARRKATAANLLQT